jgi:demethylmenaquinone methyltransferase / 2-methoxy-6-polyprenyl-1,4-benzoquinol methylase
MEPAADAPDEGRIRQVRGIFSSITDRYDFLNHFLSAGRDIYWRRFLVGRLRFLRTQRMLDLATGTGDVAIAAAAAHPLIRIWGLDFAGPMLAAARPKIAARGLAERVHLLQGDALQLPFPDACFDAVTVSFGIRNMPDRPQVFREMRRVLVPGGRVYLLEFTTPQGRLFRRIYLAYLQHLLPRLARRFTQTPEAYQYLAESILRFPYPDDFAREIRAAAFQEVEKHALTGGITYLYMGAK